MSRPKRLRACLGVLVLVIVAIQAGGVSAQRLAAPTITGFAPIHGVVGAKVTIYGHNLGGVQTVQFNGVAATNPAASATGNQIVVTVPPETTTGPGPITVITPGGTVTTTGTFTVLPTGGTAARPRAHPTLRPAIRKVTPMSGAAGTKVTITGTNLRGATTVRFGGVRATFTIPSTTRIVAIVPKHAVSGAISVRTALGSATFRSFHVTASGI
jgi:hypothetical protein